MPKTLAAGLLYFVLVFSAGFALGVIRVLAVIPVVGPRTAELIEFPVMLVITFLAAGWIVRIFAIPADLRNRLAVGLIALIIGLAAEFGFVLWLRGLSLSEYFETRDPLTGTIYYVLLLVFAAMPTILMYSSKRSE